MSAGCMVVVCDHRNMVINSCLKMFTSTVVNADEVVSQSERDVCTRQISPFMYAKANPAFVRGEASKAVSDVLRVICECVCAVDGEKATAAIVADQWAQRHFIMFPHPLQRLLNMPMPRGLRVSLYSNKTCSLTGCGILNKQQYSLYLKLLV